MGSILEKEPVVDRYVGAKRLLFIVGDRIAAGPHTHGGIHRSARIDESNRAAAAL
jgi:hypothetical protein